MRGGRAKRKKRGKIRRDKHEKKLITTRKKNVSSKGRVTRENIVKVRSEERNTLDSNSRGKKISKKRWEMVDRLRSDKEERRVTSKKKQKITTEDE